MLRTGGKSILVAGEAYGILCQAKYWHADEIVGWILSMIIHQHVVCGEDPNGR